MSTNDPKRTSRMGHWEKVAIATAFTIVAGGLTYLVLTMAAPQAASEYLEDNLWVAYFVAAYLLAPVVKRLLWRGSAKAE